MPNLSNAHDSPSSIWLHCEGRAPTAVDVLSLKPRRRARNVHLLRSRIVTHSTRKQTRDRLSPQQGKSSLRGKGRPVPHRHEDTPAAHLDCSLGSAAWRARVLCQASGSSLATSCIKRSRFVKPGVHANASGELHAPIIIHSCCVRCQISPLLVGLALSRKGQVDRDWRLCRPLVTSRRGDFTAASRARTRGSARPGARETGSATARHDGPEGCGQVSKLSSARHLGTRAEPCLRSSIQQHLTGREAGRALAHLLHAAPQRGRPVQAARKEAALLVLHALRSHAACISERGAQGGEPRCHGARADAVDLLLAAPDLARLSSPHPLERRHAYDLRGCAPRP